MKNRHAVILVLITCIFASFTLGFLAGRISAPGDTFISRLSEPTEVSNTTAPAAQVRVLPTVRATVPSEPETTPPEPTQSGLINVNTATLSQLDTLPGIGPVLAQRIIDYREAHGPFTAPAQLMLVEGIGEKRLAEILDLITVE